MQEICHNFEPAFVLQYGVCQGTSTPAGPSVRYKKNLSKGHKLEGLILVAKSNRSLWRMGMEAPVYCLFRGYFLDVEFFALCGYIHVVEKVPEDCLFDTAEAPS